MKRYHESPDAGKAKLRRLEAAHAAAKTALALIEAEIEAALQASDDEPLLDTRPSNDAGGYLDRSGAAKYLDISLAKLDALCRRERDPLPFALVGDTRRFDRETVRAWVARQRVGT